MNAGRIAIACALGASFGLATSVANNFASPSDEGSPAAIARVVSIILGSGLAWASLAVAAGVIAVAKSTAAVAGAVALVAATAAYYVLDSVLRDEPLSLYGPEIMRWLLVSILAGPVLGTVGAVARRTGVVALVAGLVIPGAAAALMLAHPPGAGAPTVTDEQIVARLVVVAAAAAGAAIVTVRFARARHRRV